MVAAEIGEARRHQRHRVKARLVEAVAGGLHRHVAHPGLDKFRQMAVQRNRLWCRVPERPLEVRPVDAQGADAGGPVAQALPDLAGEPDDRGLAIGAGDRHRRLRPLWIEPGRQLGQGPARVLVDDHGYAAAGEFGAGRGENRGGAARDGIADKVGAVRAVAHQSGEQKARLDLAAVRGEAQDIGLATLATEWFAAGRGGGQIRKQHLPSSRPKK